MKNNIIKRIVLVLIVIAAVMLLMTVKSNAASLTISTSKNSVSPGETFTVTVTLSNGAGYVTSGGQTQWLDNSSFSYSKTAGDSGSVSITASGTAADYTTEEDQQVGASAVVSIVTPSSNTSSNQNRTTEKPKEVKKSSVSTLKEILVEGQVLTPEFSVDVREYTINVPNDVATLNVTATPTDSKAKAEVEGNEELAIGENTVTITVTAEDGSESKYIIKVIRARENLILKSIVIKYTDKEGEIVEIPLDPEFNINTLEYTLEDLEYWVENLIIEAEANLEGAVIDIQGADALEIGENIITITAKIQSEEQVEEGEEPKEETIVYTIKVNKTPEPTFWEKIQNKIKAIFGGISTWHNNNQQKIVLYALCACVVALIILSIYIVIDYKKYKVLLEKIRKVEYLNTEEPQPEAEVTISNQILKGKAEEIKEVEKIEEAETVEEPKKANRSRGGKHF